jgi:hypothetical protein
MTVRRPLDDAELIERLSALSAEIAWPATPDLAGRVTAAIEAGPIGRTATAGLLDRLRALVGDGAIPGGRRIARRSVLIAVVALLGIVVAAAAIGLGVPGIRIDLRPLPTQTPAPTVGAPSPSSSIAAGSPVPTSRPTPPGQELGPVVSLDRARSDAGFGLLLPTAAGYTDPTEVHLVGAQPFTRVALWYADRTTLLTEFLGEIQPDAFQKIVGGETTVEPVEVGTADGWWIAGAPHQLVLQFRDPDGQIRWQEVTVTGNVLLWQAGSVTLRLETPLDRAGAIEVATSLR